MKKVILCVVFFGLFINFAYSQSVCVANPEFDKLLSQINQAEIDYERINNSSSTDDIAKAEKMSSDYIVLTTKLQDLKDLDSKQVFANNTHLSLYKQYCVSKNFWKDFRFYVPRSNYDDIVKQMSFMGTKQLTCKLQNKEFTGVEVGIALNELGVASIRNNDNNSAVMFYKCAANRYLDFKSSYRMAQVHYYGSKSLSDQTGGKDLLKIKENVSVAYSYVINMFYIGYELKTGGLDSTNNQGWAAIALLDSLQSKLKGSAMQTIEARQKKYLSQFISSAQDSSVSIYSHSMDAVLNALK